MKQTLRRGLAVVLTTGALVAAGGALVACGGEPARTANVKPDNMPDGQSWTGVYYHPVYGYLHMVQNDNGTVVGKWKRTDQSAWGELSGTTTGTVMHFTWKEHKYGLVGPAAETKGKGYFVYKMGNEGIPELDGEFGTGDDETGGNWHNVKQMNVKPDLNSIQGDSNGSSAPASKDKWQ
jgi:hypothetical protein